MDGIGIIFLIVGGLIILYNIIIQFSNLAKIIQYTFATNSLGSYWEFFFKNNFSLGAIISSVIGLILALVVFIIIMPFVLYRKYVLKNDIDSQLKSGLLFNYEESYPHIPEGAIFYTNIDKLSIKDLNIPSTGMIKFDAMTIINEIAQHSEGTSTDIGYGVMEKIKLNDKSTATVPLMLKINNVSYPTYILYTEEHLIKFESIKKKIHASGYKDCLYFSIEEVL